MEYLKELIDNYQPTDETKELVKQTSIALLSGVSGAGKDTIRRALLAKNDTFLDKVSHTTRSPRENNNRLEQDGVDYHFISMEEAERMVRAREFVEVKLVHNTIYGTSVSEIQKAYDQQRTALTDIDVQGVAEMKQIAPDSVSIFVVPPSYDEWMNRLMSRYNSPEEFAPEWPKRRESSIRELTHALEVPYYHFIINDELERAVRVSEEIILREDVFYEKDNEARIKAYELLKAIQSN